MPKMKTHKGAHKRYRITGSGKVVRRKINRGHLLTKKSPKRKRRLGLTAEVSRELEDRVEKALGIRIKSSNRQRAAKARLAKKDDE